MTANGTSTATLEPKAAAKDDGKRGPVRTFRLLTSLHIDDDNVIHDARDPETFIVKTHRDLVAQFGREKFVEVHAHEHTAAPIIKYVPMEAMSLTDLQNFAKDEGIDLKAAKTKPEVLKALQAALST
jgi:hypothetical protein